MGDADMADASAEPAVIKPLPSCPFLLIDISTSQAQHGLRHGDYARYRQYCTNRLRRLSKSLKFTHGTKTRYVARKLVAQDVTDPRHLLIPLVNAERAWAYAMELKQSGDDPRKRHHLVQRLAKAAKWAAELAALCAQVADARTALEAEGYSSWMSGTVLLEKETDWGAALAKFLRAKAAFEQLEKVGSLEQSAVCRQRLGELEPSLRYCSYKGGSATASDLSSALASGGGGAGLDLLKDKLAAVAAEARLKVAAEVSSIPWRGLALPVRSEGTRVLLLGANELSQQIEAAEVSGAASGERQLASFDKLLLALTDARRQVRLDLGAAAGEGPIAELRALDFAVTCMSLSGTVRRNRLLLATLQARWARQQQQQEEADGGAGPAKKGAKGGGGGKGGKSAEQKEEKPVRLQELVRLCDTLLGNVAEMAEVAGEAARAPGPAAEEARNVAAESAAEGGAVRAERCALLARAEMNSGKFAEAAALFGRAAELAQRAAASLGAAPLGAVGKGKARPAPGAGAEHQRLLALAEAVGTAARKGRCVAIVKGVSAESAGRKVATSSLEKLSLAEAAQAAPLVQSDAGYVLETLDLYEAAAGAGVKEPKLARLPPALQATPARPLFLDTALTAIEYPSLAHRVKAKEGRAGGIRSAVTSLFGWKR